jgi:hypothetical protein
VKQNRSLIVHINGLYGAGNVIVAAGVAVAMSVVAAPQADLLLLLLFYYY